MPPPEQLSTVYATDESVAVRARGDFVTLCPIWQQLASGADGEIDSGTPWLLTSSTVNFASNGVAANMVVRLTKSGTYPGSGDLLAIDSVSGYTITMRRIAQAAGVGQSPAQTTGIGFLIASLYPQIEEASFTLNRRLKIDPNIPLRSPSQLYDIRDLRKACILTVLRDAYLQESRGKDGDFPMKASALDLELEQVMIQLTVRWSSNGVIVQDTTSISSASRIVR